MPDRQVGPGRASGLAPTTGYARALMGSSGQKRKNRKHLPKVGTPAENEYALRHEREAVEENIGIRPGGPVAWIVGAVVVIFVVMAIVALIALD